MLYNGIQDPRLNEGLIRRFGMKQDAPAPQLAGEVQTGFDIGALPLELRYLFGYFCAGGHGYAPAVAGQNCGAELYNPANSGRLIVVNQFWVEAQAAANYRLGIINVGIAGAGGSTTSRKWRDTRITGVPVAYFLANGQTAAITAGEEIWNESITTTVPTVFYDVCTLFPGYGLIARSDTVNQQIKASAFWTERYPLPSEIG